MCTRWHAHAHAPFSLSIYMFTFSNPVLADGLATDAATASETTDPLADVPSTQLDEIEIVRTSPKEIYALNR